MSSSIPSAHGAMHVALDLAEAGIALMRQNLRRRFPDASHEDIDHRLRDWVRHRPGAEDGDTVGLAVHPRARFG